MDTPKTIRESIRDMEAQSRQSFIAWAKENAVPIASIEPISRDCDLGETPSADLEAIGIAIEGAPVVVLSEGFHNCREMMALHRRIIRHFVVHHGFDIVVTESGLPESRLIWDYVQGKYNPKDNNEREEMYEMGLNKVYS